MMKNVLRSLAALPALASVLALAQPAFDQQQLQRQQERDKALRERIAPDADSLGAAPAAAALEIPVDESPSFAVHALEITGDMADQVPWLKSAAGLDFSSKHGGIQLGAKGVEVVLARMQQALLARGLVTSRVFVAPQNLQEGVLRVVFVPGVLHAVRFDPQSIGGSSVATALSSKFGALLQLRDIEQGLENFKRVPTAEADIQIVAAQQPGQSDLLIHYQKAKPLRFNLALDDGGTESTGKVQGTATVSWDNPLGLNDLAYLSLGRGLGNGAQRGTKNHSAHYSIPFGYWLLALSGAQNKYHHQVAGAYETYVYSGESSNLDVQLSRVVYRSASSKSTLAVKAFTRSSSNSIDDTEVDVHRRRTAGYELSLAQRSHWGAAQWDARLAFKRGTGAFGALEAPEEPWGEGTARMQLYTADLALAMPVEIAGKKLKFSSAWHRQWNATALTPQDRMAIGGRYTVRGFDGESSLVAERGWYGRNELAMALPLAQAAAEGFVGFDLGRVGGPSAQYLAGQSLMGAAMGLRGAWRGLSFELTLSAPVQKPEKFRTAKHHVAINLAYSF